MTFKRSTRPLAVSNAGGRRRVKQPRNRAISKWQLPSGKGLADFALASGFLAPPLLADLRTLRSGEKETS